MNIGNTVIRKKLSTVTMFDLFYGIFTNGSYFFDPLVFCLFVLRFRRMVLFLLPTFSPLLRAIEHPLRDCIFSDHLGNSPRLLPPHERVRQQRAGQKKRTESNQSPECCHPFVARFTTPAVVLQLWHVSMPFLDAPFNPVYDLYVFSILVFRQPLSGG